MNVVSGGSRWHLCSGVLWVDVVSVGVPCRGALCGAQTGVVDDWLH